jgi:hypothetical protein
MRMSRFASFDYVDEFHIESDFNDPDTITVGLVVRDADDQKGVVKVTFTGDVTYPSNSDEHTGLTMPQSEDFLQQFAAFLGYRVVKD